MPYVLDADIFIQAKNQYYGFDFCPAFWDWLEMESRNGVVRSIQKVGQELTAGNDELAAWAARLGGAFFVPPVQDLPAALATVSTWAGGQSYDSNAVISFLQRADYYLVAHALASGDTVVTHEVPSTSPRRIKIPDACDGVSAERTTLFAMLRAEGARFVLQTTP